MSKMIILGQLAVIKEAVTVEQITYYVENITEPSNVDETLNALKSIMTCALVIIGVDTKNNIVKVIPYSSSWDNTHVLPLSWLRILSSDVGPL
jgi:isopentenyl diphosphate isomerase/L-lactate dehydrogenase-like FMN-dependent dehydrogenase